MGDLVGTVAPASASSVLPVIYSVSATPSSLGLHGGVVHVKPSTQHATSCWIELLSRQSFPVVYSTNARPCAGFHPTIVVGANPTSARRVIAFTLVARNGSAWVERHFYLSLAPNYPWVPSPRTAASGSVIYRGPGTPPNPLTTSMSGSWSGYEVSGSGFQSVRGSFTVPRLTNDLTCKTNEAEWVGIDGFGGNQDLIQAGVEENAYDDSMVCQAPKYFYIRAWWEILPAPSTAINTIRVRVGDKVTVVIAELSASYWSITVTDDTNGQSFSTKQPYTGPGQSAEWVSEAGSNSPLGWLGCTIGITSQCTETGYTPPVTFTGLGFNVAYITGVKAMTMSQGTLDLKDVSTPSWRRNLWTLLGKGFFISYTG